MKTCRRPRSSSVSASKASQEFRARRAGRSNLSPTLDMASQVAAKERKARLITRVNSPRGCGATAAPSIRCAVGRGGRLEEAVGSAAPKSDATTRMDPRIGVQAQPWDLGQAATVGCARTWTKGERASPARQRANELARHRSGWVRHVNMGNAPEVSPAAPIPRRESCRGDGEYVASAGVDGPPNDPDARVARSTSNESDAGIVNLQERPDRVSARASARSTNGSYRSRAAKAPASCGE
jgi:hypothetical protein